MLVLQMVSAIGVVAAFSRVISTRPIGHDDRKPGWKAAPAS